MARTFLTNINLNNNELQNAVIQNLSLAPNSGNKEGRLYLDSVTHKLRVYLSSGPQGAGWYDLAVGGSVASRVILTGDVTGDASVDPATGIITLDTHFNVSGTENQITVNDIDNTTTIALANDVDIVSSVTIGSLTKDGHINFINASGTQIGQIGADNSDLAISSSNGNLLLYSDGNVVAINDGNGELHLQKTEYWRSGTLQGVIAAQSDGSLRVTGTNSGLQLESNSGNININPSSTITIFNNNLQINGDGAIISTDVNSLHLTAANNVVTTDASEFHTTKVELWNGGDTTGTRQGIIVAHPSDGSLTIASSNELHLESHGGDIKIDSQSGLTQFNSKVYIDHDGTVGTDTGNLILTPDSGTVVINSRAQIGSIANFGNGLASSEGYHGYNNYTTTEVINLNGFIKLSSEGNNASGYLFVNSNTSANESAPTLHLESNGDLALRAGANGNEGNIILYTGETSSGQPGKAYIGWGNSRYIANPTGEIATIGTEQTFTNKVIDNATLKDTTSFTDGSNALGGTIYSDSGNLIITSNSGDIVLQSDANLSVTAGLSTFNGSVSITGDLNVQGTLTAINKTEIDIADNTIVLNSNVTTGTPSQDAAITVRRGSANDVGIIWSEGNKDWTLTNDGNHYFAVARKYADFAGNGSALYKDIVHNLNTTDVTVQTYLVSSGDLVDADVKITDANTVRVSFAVAPTTNAIRVVVVG